MRSKPDRPGLGTILICGMLGTAAQAQPFGEPHLSILPLSASETARATAAKRNTQDFSKPERFEARPAGAATQMRDISQTAFSQPSANLADTSGIDFEVGRALFEKLWVTAPSATDGSDGLGPLYNARACNICHSGNGRGHPPKTSGHAGALVLRVSIPDNADPKGGRRRLTPNTAEPTYGVQIQDRSIAGIPTEARIDVTYQPIPVTLGDGTIIELRKPDYALDNLGYGPLHPDAQLSPRIAPQMIGLGLLEAIPEADILAHADPEDLNGDGISGRPNIVWSSAFGQPMIGRFGLKAGAPTVRAQSMDALNTDIGLSNPLRPDAAGDCTARQTSCLAAPNGNSVAQGGLEASGVVMDLITLYSRNLAVPARRNPDATEVLQGKKLFYDAGCPVCHVPKFVTHKLSDRREQSFQLIWPYSDLLLHDMGEGLADHRPEWQATGREWRTPPLWGIGLTQTVSGQKSFLHDGRARSILEAILWHGGEAEAARQSVVNMNASDRDALISFLESL